jgi:hypothetical protein
LRAPVCRAGAIVIENRLIIAYTLIALLVLVGVGALSSVVLRSRRRRDLRRQGLRRSTLPLWPMRRR